jgi:hypothetical protein
MHADGVEGRSFNLVADPCLSAQEYLDELDRAGKMKIQRHATSISSFYRADMMKWMVKLAVRHPERRIPLIATGKAGPGRRYLIAPQRSRYSDGSLRAIERS